MIDLTVITCTIPERAQMLAQLAAALDAQTVRPEWMIEIDDSGHGPVPNLNSLVDRADTEWVFRLDDDDLVDPEHFEILSAHLTDDFDVVYSWPRIDPTPADGRFTEDGLQVVFPLASLEERNFIASAAAVRRSLWVELGGLSNVPEEDADFWVRAWRAGARFRCIPQVTWTYRLGDWPHRSDKEAVRD